MRLILFDGPPATRANFSPLALSHPIWELRCGMSTLGEKLIAKIGPTEVAGFVPEYMADACRETAAMPINDPASLAGDDLLMVCSQIKAADFDIPATGPSQIAFNEDGGLLYARIAAADLAKVAAANAKQQSPCAFAKFMAKARAALPVITRALPTYNYLWDLILENPAQITTDFAATGRSGIEGTVEKPAAIRGANKDVYVGPGAVVHPMAVLDAEHGPIYLDEEVTVHPFTRIEGPCYVGKKSVLLGAKCREGNSIGPVCRVGGEIEESIIHAYSNKYHDGFLGHAYVGEWVNLGALTTNSDLKNDYSHVSVMLDGKNPINTGSTKVGSLIGDHTKTSIGVLINTGAYLGAMCLILTNGKLLPKFIPSFAWVMDAAVTKGFGRQKLYETAKMAMARRQRQWTDAQERMWEAVFEMTAPARKVAVKKGRKSMFRSR